MPRLTLEDLPEKYRAQVLRQIEVVPHAAPDRKISHAQPKQDQAPALGATVPGETESVRRVTVSFTGWRVKPLDPDNFAGSVKDLLDGLRHANLIRGDEWWRIKLETDQVKVAHYADEKTEIRIY